MSSQAPDPTKIHAVFAAVHELEVQDRTAEIERLCGDDADLRAAVERLLATAVDDPWLGEDHLAAIRSALLPDDAAGTVPDVLGDYRIEGVLGRGGMGVVYRARQRQPNRAVALKVLPRAAGPDAMRRFELEAETLGRLRHPNIAQIYAAGTIDSDGEPRAFLAMELVDGTDLQSWARSTEPTRNARIGMLITICEAVQHAHQKGVIHRDLKPSNVLVDQDGRPRVVDFGIARLVSEDTRQTLTGQILGTLAYMSPEQADGQSELVDTRADVYALGVIGYQLLGGTLPIDLTKSSVTRALRQLVEQPPVPLGQHDRALRGDLQTIFAACLQKAPEARYPSAMALADDLRRYLAHQPVRARRPSRLYEFNRFARRHRVLLTATVLTVLALAVGLWISVQATRAARRAETRESRLRIEATELAESNAKLAAAEQRQRRAAEANLERYHQLRYGVLLRRAMAAVATTVPAWPSQLDEIRDWQDAHATPLRAAPAILDEALRDVEARATPLSPAERQADLEAHPQYRYWQGIRAEAEHFAAALAISSGQADHPPEVALDADAAALDDKALESFIWSRIALDPKKRTVRGEQAQALAAARLLVRRIETRPDSEVIDSDGLDADAAITRCRAHEILSWALAANGHHEAATAAAVTAAEAATGLHRLHHRRQQASLKSAIAAASGERGQRLLARLEAEVTELGAEIERRRTFRFADTGDEFLHSTLTELRDSIAEFERTTVTEVQARADWANAMAELTLDHPNAGATWAAASAAIRRADGAVASAAYAARPFDLQPQWGLVPIGMNPQTLLWEFYHLRSGFDPNGTTEPADLAIPRHRADGTIEVTGATGIVFVLVPGGEVTLGAQKTDPDAPNYDPAADDSEALHTVTLEPYFIARHELTQAQFVRLTGADNPSQYPAGAAVRRGARIGLDHPVEMIDWLTADRLLTQHGLALPTEAQWERAARGGTTTVWWTGQERESLRQDGIAANLADRAAARAGVKWPATRDWPDYDDGWLVHAPVDDMRMNPFGLHHVHGNVWEWCRDRYVPFGFLPPRRGDGLREVTQPGPRTRRGGGFGGAARVARSTARETGAEERRSHVLGVRPARSLQAPTNSAPRGR